jgi:hypothetical protein
MMLLNIVNLSSFYFSHYKITESALIVKHGFILRTKIPFEDIRHIKYSVETPTTKVASPNPYGVTGGILE